MHNHGAKTDQSPLRMAVTDLNMDARMIDLLVSYGASPFLEAKDGKSACAMLGLMHFHPNTQMTVSIYLHRII